MAIKLYFVVVAVCCLTFAFTNFAQNSDQFIYNGFKQANLHLDGGATVHPNGLLQLTNASKQLKAHAFHPNPLKFGTPSSLSFSTTFAFAMNPQTQIVSGLGMVFILAPSMDFALATAGKFLGLFNDSTVGNSTNHIFGVELDTLQNLDLKDIDSNHVGIDVNSVISVASASAGYFSDTENRNKTLRLLSAKAMQIWIDYDHVDMVVKVTMAPLGVSRPSKPLLSTRVNLSEVVLDTMYAGFSSSTGTLATSHYVLGWSFIQGTQAQAPILDLSKLPKLPRFGNRRKELGLAAIISLIVTSAMVMISGIVLYIRWRKKYEEILEDWEQEYLLQRFSYKELYKATKGFKDNELLGAGGFGKVYKGKLPSTKLEVAVKKVSHGSSQGTREFVAEIACMGRLRHRNLVQLLGYCRRRGELLLVYEFMPNGSLDKYLYNAQKSILSWPERFKIIRDVACALVYLHEEWEQVVVHRDVKASNVLLDANMNARLGDFGLARLYDHGTNPQTTHIVGTIGYLAPELIRKGKATTSTDVFSFGIFLLEVACGRSPISLQAEGERYLVDFVHDCWKTGLIIEASDPRLQGNYVQEEVELALKLGMMCSHPKPDARPSMRQVLQYLDKENILPEMIPYGAKLDLSKYTNQTMPPAPSSSLGTSTSYSNVSVLVSGR